MDQEMTVNTAGIGKGFASQLAIISVHAQRKLVGLLFFWENECMRWKLLDAEEKEIMAVLEELRSDLVNGSEIEVDSEGELRIRLEAVRMKRKLLPSQRAEATPNVGTGKGHELPAYE